MGGMGMYSCPWAVRGSAHGHWYMPMSPETCYRRNARCTLVHNVASRRPAALGATLGAGAEVVAAGNTATRVAAPPHPRDMARPNDEQDRRRHRELPEWHVKVAADDGRRTFRGRHVEVDHNVANAG